MLIRSFNQMLRRRRAVEPRSGGNQHRKVCFIALPIKQILSFFSKDFFVEDFYNAPSGAGSPPKGSLDCILGIFRLFIGKRF